MCIFYGYLWRHIESIAQALRLRKIRSMKRRDHEITKSGDILDVWLITRLRSRFRRLSTRLSRICRTLSLASRNKSIVASTRSSRILLTSKHPMTDFLLLWINSSLDLTQWKLKMLPKKIDFRGCSTGRVWYQRRPVFLFVTCNFFQIHNASSII